MGPFHRSELKAPNIENLTFDEEELVVSLGKSKTNQSGQAKEKAIFYSSGFDVVPGSLTTGLAAVA